MKRTNLLCALFGLGLICSMWGAAQEKGNWRAASSTAKGITGDVGFTDVKIAIDFSAFTIAQIRDLKPAEVSALFGEEAGVGVGTGNLFRTSIPGDKKFLHHNTLCGNEDVQWVATYVVRHDLHLAFFSGPSMPVLTAELIANTTNLCGTYAYVR